MFTGIVETTGVVTALRKEGGNLHISIGAPFVSELKINQSIAHNGTCLSVTDIKEKEYTVTAIQETLKKTNLSTLKIQDFINIERCIKVGERLDGHIVQGHVDCTATCTQIKETNGSWLFEFTYTSDNPQHITIEKGSVCVNGVSLTVVDSFEGKFSVAVIPFTFEHTNLKFLKEGDDVNVEFDMLGKYAIKLLLRTEDTLSNDSVKK